MECAIITVYGYDSYTKSTDDYWGVRIKAVHGSSRKNIEMISHILTGDEFFCLYAHAHIFVFPSEYEAMSMALLEVLSFGIPTVYSNIPENEAVAHDLGYAFQVSDANSLADQLHYVLTHQSEAIAVGKKAKEFIKKNHNWATIANQYNEVYMKLRRKGLNH